MLGARTSAVVFDCFVFGLTWIASRPLAALGHSTTMAVMMKDTATYFGLLFVLNVVAITFTAAHITQFLYITSAWTAMSVSSLMFQNFER
ncbi:uncharacterized protein C8Q71DRAFT_762325 [Rhodofomes roseus]|uniref:Uncharacterized protein n=1 Tax=Rhodofomes roseus TaxID=34475 RepID=A0ABQ8KGH6_9APHY|nr:uncharacterized protein C8Q71DRAFT_762325 [Rhodofomes roseus]KAH9836386.1 hypothetical protein C8Q71DRAFT_762325 [Rhodofomes roseus]